MTKSNAGIVLLGAVFLVAVASVPGVATDVTWQLDASGDWGTAANWSSDPTLPGSTDDVTIDKPAVLTVTVDQTVPGVRRLVCEENLSITGGNLTVGAGGGWINGTLELGSYHGFSVDGGVFDVNGAINVVAHYPRMNVLNGGQLKLSNFTPFTYGVSISAESGGHVNASALTSLPGDFWFEANGSNSEIDVCGLGSFNYACLDAIDNGTIRVANGLSALSEVCITVGNGGSFLNADGLDALPGISSMTDMSVTANKSVPSFDSVAGLTGTYLIALGGGELTLPALTTVTPASSSWTESSAEASGTGSLIDLNSVTTIDGPDASWELALLAYNGGRVNMPNATITSPAAGGLIVAETSGSDAVVDIRSLKNLTIGGRGSRLDLNAKYGGKIIISDEVTKITQGAVGVWSGGTIEDSAGNNALKQLTAVTDSQIDLYGASSGLENVTEISGSSLELQWGGQFTLADSAAPYQIGGDFNDSALWSANGTNTVLDLSTLASIQSSGFDYLRLRAYNGGVLNASSLTQIPDGGEFSLYSTGTNSVINVANLSYLGDSFPSIEARDGGKIVIDKPSMDSVFLTVSEGGKVERSDGSDGLSRMTGFTNGILCVGDDQSVTLSNCTDVGGSDLEVWGGVNLTLGASVTDFSMGGDYCSYANWYADNRYAIPGSGVLDLSSLQTISATEPWELSIELDDGGKLDLSGVKSLPADGYLEVEVGYDGQDCLLDLSSFEGLGGANTTAQIFVGNGGTVQFNSTGTTDLAGVYLEIGWQGQLLAEELDLGLQSMLLGDGLITANVLNSAGHVEPNEILTIDGNYTQGVGGELWINIAGSGGGGSDVLEIAGDAVLDGTLDIDKIDSFDILDGMEFVILDLTDPTKTLSGTFAGLAEGAAAWTGADNTLFITYAGGDGNDVVLFALVPEPTTIALLVSGGLCLGLLWRRKRSA